MCKIYPHPQDFRVLFDGACEIRSGNKQPVNKNDYAKIGRHQFKRVVEFVSVLPHVQEVTKEEDLEFGTELSDVIFRKVKSVIIEVVWGEYFHSLFPLSFENVFSSKHC